MYYINELLIRNIHTMHRMSQREFSTFAFGKNQFFPQRLCRFQLFTVPDIVQLSNATHIPIRHFFCSEKEGRLYGSLADIKKTGWKDITVNLDQLKKISLGEGYSFSRPELLAFLNVDASCFWKWANLSFVMRAQMLCDMCNEFGIDMSDLIIDRNEPIPPATTNKYGSKTKAKITRLKRRIEAQDEVINSKEQQVKNAERERDEALDAAAQAKHSKTVVKTHYVTKPKDSEWEWQAQQWSGDDIPTLTQLVGYCNRHNITTLPFLRNPNHYGVKTRTDSLSTAQAAEGELEFKANITIDYMAYNMLTKSLGITDTPDTISIVKFIRILQDNHLTPACCINDPNAHYPTTLPDRMVRSLGNVGVTA